MSKIHKQPWWGAPRNFTDRLHERKISWLELFYDLVYAAAITQITHHLSEHPTWQYMWFSFLLFALVFWSWVNGSQYYDLHGNAGIRTRLITFWQMLAVAAVAITINDAYEGHHQAFAIAFATIQLLITYMWWSVGIYDPSHRQFNIFYTVNYLIALALIVISIFTSAHVAIILWICVALLDLTPSLTAARKIITALKKQGAEFTASASIVERLGLVTIIVLAESILGTVSAIVQIHDKHMTTWFTFILGILIAFLLWTIYFDMTNDQEVKKGYRYLQYLIFLHFPLLAALSVTGACMTGLMSDSGNPMFQWMFCVSVSTVLITIVGVTHIMEQEHRPYIKPVSRILIMMGLLVLVVPLFHLHFSTLAFLGSIAFVLLVPVIAGIRGWVRHVF